MSVDAAEQLFHDWQCPDIAALYQLAASYRRTPGE